LAIHKKIGREKKKKDQVPKRRSKGNESTWKTKKIKPRNAPPAGIINEERDHGAQIEKEKKE